MFGFLGGAAGRQARGHQRTRKKVGKCGEVWGSGGNELARARKARKKTTARGGNGGGGARFLHKVRLAVLLQLFLELLQEDAELLGEFGRLCCGLRCVEGTGGMGGVTNAGKIGSGRIDCA